MNPTFTLADIRKRRPYERGWKTLLRSLGYTDCAYDPERRVSLGDVALINGAADAWWCARCLDWTDIAVRRAVIAALLLAAKRASAHTTDQGVHDCVASVTRWCAGDDAVDLRKAAAAAWVQRAAEATAKAAAAEEAAAWVQRAAAAAACVAWVAGWAAEATAERAHQRADIIAAFPPVAMAEGVRNV